MEMATRKFFLQFSPSFVADCLLPYKQTSFLIGHPVSWVKCALSQFKVGPFARQNDGGPLLAATTCRHRRVSAM